MTKTGKTTLHDQLILHDYRAHPQQDIIVFDTKPCYRGAHELTGLSTRWRYRKWDTGKGIVLPDSVVISPETGDPDSAIEQAWAQHYRLVVAQVRRHADIPWLAAVMRHSYEHKRKNRPLRFVIDELNHWMYRNKKQADDVIEYLTSGRENNVGMLLGAQRPRNVGVNSIESATVLYWFWTPWEEDQKHLRSMGIPTDAKPGPRGSHIFYCVNMDTGVRGPCKLPPPPAALRRKGG